MGDGYTRTGIIAHLVQIVLNVGLKPNMVNFGVCKNIIKCAPTAGRKWMGDNMNNLLNIPAHTNCKNCGECCGIIPASSREVEEIKSYLKEHPTVQKQAQKQSGRLTCPFRDDKGRKCLIYPVRPIICRLMGVVDGMNCPNGNSACIDGTLFLKDISIESALILNALKW